MSKYPSFTQFIVCPLPSVPYETFDILQDEDVRQGLKIYSNWPTYPQVYVKGELIGGLDIISELKANNELIPTLDPDINKSKH